MTEHKNFKSIPPALVPMAILALSASLAATTASAAEFIPLGKLPGNSESRAYGVSDDGKVVAGSSLFGTAPRQAFRWTEEEGMIGLGALPGDNASIAGANGQQPISANGRTIVGTSGSMLGPDFDGPVHGEEVVLFKDDGSIQRLRSDSYHARNISGDGNVVVGYFDTQPTNAWRWSDTEGVVPLTPIGRNVWFRATDLNYDGSVVIGFGGRESESDNFYEIVKWTGESGLENTGILIDRSGSAIPSTPDSSIPASTVVAVSDDGSTLASTNFVSSDTGYEAFYWTQESGVVGLGWLPRQPGEVGALLSVTRDMTPDGRLIVGWSGLGVFDVRPFVWTEQGGMEDFEAVLREEHGLLNDFTDWKLVSIQGVSSNGQFFTGYGYNPDGDLEAWLVRLDAPWGSAVPEPATLAIAFFTLAPLVVCRSRLKTP